MNNVILCYSEICYIKELVKYNLWYIQSMITLFSEMSGYELLSDQGLRADGRRAKELRRIRCRQGVFGQADGSAYLEQGNTKVLAAVYGPHEAGRRTGGGGLL